MNSEYIRQKRPTLSGASCPLNAIRNDTAVNSLFRNFYAKDMSPLVRLRVFEGYKDFSTLTGVNNEQISIIAKELISPFIKFSYASVQEFMEKGNPSAELEISRAIIREQLKHMFKNTKNINVVIDNGFMESVHVGCKPSVKFLFDYNHSSVETGPLQDPIKCTWSSGCISFIGGNDVSVTVFIPVQRIKEIILESFSRISSEEQKNVTDVSLSSAFKKARQIMSDDLTNGVISALYSDRFRENILSQIKAMYSMISQFVTGKFTIPNINADDSVKKEYKDMVNGYMQALMGKYLDPNSMDHPAIPSLKYIIDKTYSSNGVIQVHPWIIYNLFAHHSDIELSSMLEKLHTSVTGINGKYDRDHTISLSYLTHDFDNDHADIMATCIQIMRTLPFTLFTVFVYGHGSKYGNYIRYISNIKDFIKTVETVGNSSLNMKNILKYCNQINEYIEYAETVLSNPRLPEYMDEIITSMRTM